VSDDSSGRERRTSATREDKKGQEGQEAEQKVDQHIDQQAAFTALRGHLVGKSLVYGGGLWHHPSCELHNDTTIAHAKKCRRALSCMHAPFVEPK
jgi:hypothetical protein